MNENETKKRILLIDDEELVIKSVRKLFEKEGFGVLIARNGDEAVGVVKTEDVDLAVCDVRMPGKGGVETIREIQRERGNQGKPPVPFIFLTGYADDDLEAREQDLHPAAIVYKPFDAFKLLELIRSVIGGKTESV
jgi:CheY-like chemotaxis protein